MRTKIILKTLLISTYLSLIVILSVLLVSMCSSSSTNVHDDSNLIDDIKECENESEKIQLLVDFNKKMNNSLSSETEENLTKLIDKTDNIEIKKQCCISLIKFGSANAKKHIINQLNNTDKNFIEALIIIIRENYEHIKTELIEGLSYDNYLIRSNSIKCLNYQKLNIDINITNKILGMLNDNSKDVKINSLRYLKTFTIKDSIIPIRNLIKNTTDIKIRTEAENALISIRNSILKNVKEKTLLAIYDIENKTNDKKYETIIKNFKLLVTTKISQLGIFTLLDRENIDKAANELSLSRNEFFDHKNAIKIGKQLSTKFIACGEFFIKNKDKLSFRIDIINIEKGSIITTNIVSGYEKNIDGMASIIANDIVDAYLSNT